MGRLFEKAAGYTDFSVGKKFSDVLEAAKAHTPDLTWQELSIFNWACKTPQAVNRQLAELIGCKKLDNADPSNTEFDTECGPGGAPEISLPKLVKVPLEGGKTHTIQIKQKRPAPAISIGALTRWFIPKDETCQIQYTLEGVKERAEFVDFEVHTEHYVEADKAGGLTPSKTQAAEGSTHILQKSKLLTVTTLQAPSAVQNIATWKGESEATEGMLKTGGAAPYINYACAPYTVLLRFYKNSADNQAKIALECFCPKWKRPASKGAAPLIDEASLTATWTISGDNGKLKQGQLILWDKDDKEILRIGLNETKIQAGTFDFGPKWKAKFDRKFMPYRLQLQAHSDQVTADGLALAVMHTQVRAFLYDEVQFIAFNIKPGTTKTSPPQYLGVDKPEDDIKKRCEITVDAIRKANTLAIDKSENVLKLFMAPEFYFRGSRGAYPFDQIDSIMTTLRAEAQKFEYADWLFVYGTAIGSLEHQDGMAPIQHGAAPRDYNMHNITIKSVADDAGAWFLAEPADKDLFDSMDASMQAGVGWKASQDAIDLVQELGKDDRWQVTADTAPVAVAALEKTTGKVTLAARKTFDLVAGNKHVFLLEPIAWILEKREEIGKTIIKVKSAIPARIPVGEVRWKANQGSINGVIESTAKISGGIYEIKFTSNPAFVVGAVVFEEPVTTEVMNVALVQKGWPANYPCKRKLKQAVVYKEYVSAIDFLSTYFGKHSEFHEATGAKRLIDINSKKDVAVLPTEGSVDVLGASPNRPGGTTTWTDKDGDVHVVGSEINKSGEGGGSVITVDDITFGIEVCLDHAKGKLSKFYDSTSPVGGDPKVQVQLIPSWGMNIDGGPICTVPNGLVFNVDGARCDSALKLNDDKAWCPSHNGNTGPVNSTCYYKRLFFWCASCNKTVAPKAGKCATHPTVVLQQVYMCVGCYSVRHTGNVSCSCGKTAVILCNQMRTLRSTGIAALGAKTDVASANDPVYFEKPGHILLYPKQKIPEPEFV